MADTTSTQATPSFAPPASPAGSQMNEAVRASLQSLASARRAERNRRRRDRGLVLLTAGLTISAVWVTSRLLQTPKPAAIAVAVGQTPSVEREEAKAPALARPETAPEPMAATPPVEGQPNSGPLVNEDVLSAAAVPPVEPLNALGITDIDAARADCVRAAHAKPWRTAVDLCTKLFDIAPHPKTALALAKAHYRGAQVQEAGVWAQKAAALDDSLAEAFVILAYAAESDGNKHDAATAFRRYLSLAPRGWHATQARQGLHRLR